MSKLGLDRDKIELAKKTAERIVAPVYHTVERHTSVSIERAILRLLGVSGACEDQSKHTSSVLSYPLVNAVVDKLGKQSLSRGVGYWMGLAALHFPQSNANQLAKKIVTKEIKLTDLPSRPQHDIDQACSRLLQKKIKRLREVRAKQSQRPTWSRPLGQPLRCVEIIAQDVESALSQAEVAVELGADIISLRRSSAQSLFDFVPEGKASSGQGGLWATQENFRIIRQQLDDWERKFKRRIALTQDATGLCMPELVVLGALEAVDFLTMDTFYGVLFRDIHMKRNFVDQHFAKRIAALSSINIQTSEHRILESFDSFKTWPQVVASYLLNQAFAKKAGVADSHLCFNHSYAFEPQREDATLHEWAQAQLVRELFPRSPLQFKGPEQGLGRDPLSHLLHHTLFSLASLVAGQNIQCVSSSYQETHHFNVQEQYWAAQSSDLVFGAARGSKEELRFQAHGKVARRARQILDDALSLLKKIKYRGLARSLSEGALVSVRRSEHLGRGMEGILHQDRQYFTPLSSYLTPRAFQTQTASSRYRTRGGRGRTTTQPRRNGRKPGASERARGSRSEAPPRKAMARRELGKKEMIEPKTPTEPVSVSEQPEKVATKPAASVKSLHRRPLKTALKQESAEATEPIPEKSLSSTQEETTPVALPRRPLKIEEKR